MTVGKSSALPKMLAAKSIGPCLYKGFAQPRHGTCIGSDIESSPGESWSGSARFGQRFRLALPQLPGADVVAPRLDLAAFFGAEVVDLAAERDGFLLHLRAALEVDGAADDVGQRLADRGDAVPAQQDRGLVAELHREVVAELRV